MRALLCLAPLVWSTLVIGQTGIGDRVPRDGLLGAEAAAAGVAVLAFAESQAAGEAWGDLLRAVAARFGERVAVRLVPSEEVAARRVWLGPRSLRALFVVQDFLDMRVSTFRHLEGAWPPPRGYGPRTLARRAPCA